MATMAEEGGGRIFWKLRTHRWNLVGLKSQLAVAVAMHTTSMGASMGNAWRGVCGVMRRER
jgi:hypothetical protein